MRTRQMFLASLLVLAIGACETSNGATLSQQELAELTEQFQVELDGLYEAAKSTDEIFPGATAAFMLSDSRIVGVATGYSDVEEGIPMTPEMRMPSGSIGKTYVAAVALSLAHDGVLNLDDKISKWLGEEEWFPRLPNGRDITLRNLLNHSSGMVDHVFDVPGFLTAMQDMVAEGDAERYLTPLELVEFALDQEPLFPPGKGFNYTDTGYLLAGLVMDEASGSAYYDELERRILDPLEFTYTLPQDRRGVPNLSQGYGVTSAELFGTSEKVVEDGRLTFNPIIEWTGGGVFNNPQDLVRWAKTLYEGDALPKPYVNDLFGSVAWAGFDDSTQVYGLGVAISEGELGKRYGHGGFFPGYNSQMAYFPEQGVAVAMQINTDRSRVGDHILALAKVVLDALP